jgi:hypothetical protein
MREFFFSMNMNAWVKRKNEDLVCLKKWRVSHGQLSKPLTSLSKAYYPVHQVPFLDQLKKKKTVVFTASSVKIFTASLSSIYVASSSCNLFFPRRASHHPCARAANQELRPNSLDLPYSATRRQIADSNHGGDPVQVRASLIPTPPGEKLPSCVCDVPLRS